MEKHFDGNSIPEVESSMATIKALFHKTAGEPCPETSHKVTVVGCGQVGMATIFSILAQGISRDMTILDVMEDKLKGERMDLEHGSLFLGNPRIQAGKDYALSAGSKICIITAGVRQAEGESRLNLVQRNVDVLKHIVPQLIQYSPDCILLIVSNPVDLLTYVAWKLSGLPHHRVIGCGTNLDSSRFRFLISQRLGCSSTSVHGWIIGEHGDSSVAVWSGVNVAGVRLKELSPKMGTEDDVENWKAVHKAVVASAYEVIKLKGFTNWAIGLAAASQVSNILYNQHNIMPISVYIKGYHGIDSEVFLSLPAVLGASGVEKVVNLVLSPEEEKLLQDSAKAINEIQQGLKI